MYINNNYKISIIEIKKGEILNNILFLKIENDIKIDKINVYLLYFLDDKINIIIGEVNNISENIILIILVHVKIIYIMSQ